MTGTGGLNLKIESHKPVIVIVQMEAIILGTWGFDIFEDDLTMDVQDCFDELKVKGFNPFEATVKVMNIFADVLREDDCKFLVFVALTKLQMESGSLQKKLLDKFLDIDENVDLDKWKKSGLTQYWKRKSVIKKFKKEIGKIPPLSKVTFESLKYCITDTDNPENLKFTVYELYNPNTGKPVYVGSTAYYNQRTKFMKTQIFD